MPLNVFVREDLLEYIDDDQDVLVVDLLRIP
jgi:hypothetical protein